MTHKILEVDEHEIDQAGIALIQNSALKFINGAYTHLRCDGCVTEAWVVHDDVVIGMDVSDSVN